MYRRALRAVVPLWPLCLGSLQERRHLCQPPGRGVQVRVSARRLREALLRDDHAQLPPALLSDFQGPQPALSLHPLSHVSTSASPAAGCSSPGSPALLHRLSVICDSLFIHPHILFLHARLQPKRAPPPHIYVTVMVFNSNNGLTEQQPSSVGCQIIVPVL